MRSFSSILLLSTKVLVTHAWSPQLYSDPIVIQIHADTLSGHAELSIRSPANNSIFGAGLTGAALSSDKQYVLPPLFSRCNAHCYDRSYYAVIQAGPVNLRVDLDTASSDLWIVSSACETNTCSRAPRYPLTYESSTFLPVNGNTTAFNARYADTTCIYHLLSVFCITNLHDYCSRLWFCR